MNLQINPVMIGFLLAIPIYFIGLFVYNKFISKSFSKKREIQEIKRKEYIETLRSDDFKNLKQWIIKAKKSRIKKRAIIKTLKKNGWEDFIINQALKQIQESEEYDRKIKTKIPNWVIPEPSKGYPQERNGIEESNTPIPRTESPAPERSRTREDKRDDDGSGKLAEHRVFQIQPARNPQPNKQKSKWDWENGSSDRTDNR